MSTTQRVVVIGAGHWHRELFLPTLLELPEAELVGVADPDPALARRLGAELGCAASPDYRRLCAQLEPDFVLALGAHDQMATEAEYLIGQRIPFAMEKPCGVSAAQVRRLAERARAAGVFASVPFVWRQSELLALMRERFADEEISYLSFRWIAGPPSRYPESGCDWMLDPARSGGGCTINLSVHLFDLALLLFGPGTEVATALMGNAAYRLPVEDYSLVALRKGDRSFTVETGYLLPGPHSQFDMRFSIKAGRHYLIATGPTEVEIVSEDGGREVVRAHTTNVAHYPAYVRDVLRRARTGEAPLANLDDMAEVLNLVEDAYRIGWRNGGT